MKIAVIGGSVGGLLTGIALKENGHQVDIYERSATDMESRGAGLVIQPNLMEYMIAKGISSHQLFGVSATERQILNEHGDATYRYRNDTSFTSWNYLWKQLKQFFPVEQYHYGYRLTSVKQNGDTVTGHFAEGSNITADLLVGVDGYGSIVREYLYPGVAPVYSGYIAYRGLISEEELTVKEAAFFSNKFTLYPYQHSHLLAYLVPGKHGELSEGKRQLNWVWFVNKTYAERDIVMTDKNGLLREFSMPATFLSDTNIAGLHTRAKKELPQILADRVLQTTNPFVQVITDMEVPQMYRGRVAILGDAASIVRPHTASGTAKAYEDAVSLAASLAQNRDIDNALKYWNAVEMPYAADLITYGKQLAKGSGLGFY